jgi:hypothetical protein
MVGGSDGFRAMKKPDRYRKAPLCPEAGRPKHV